MISFNQISPIFCCTLVCETRRWESPAYSFSKSGVSFSFLEGAESVVRPLMQKIAIDKRHTNIRILIDEPVSDRAFEQWSMDHFEVDTEFQLDPNFLSKVVAAYRRNLQIDGRALANVIQGFVLETALETH